MEAWGCCAAEKKQERYKNVNHMMTNHDIATVREFMLFTVRVSKGYFCYWLRKNWPILTNSPIELPQNIESPPLLVPPARISEIISLH